MESTLANANDFIMSILLDLPINTVTVIEPVVLDTAGVLESAEP